MGIGLHDKWWPILMLDHMVGLAEIRKGDYLRERKICHY